MHVVGRLDLGHRGAVPGEALVSGVTDAVAGALLPGTACPAGELCHLLDHGRRAWVGQVRQPERDRVGPGAFGQLVHERLDREHVEERTEGA